MRIIKSFIKFKTVKWHYYHHSFKWPPTPFFLIQICPNYSLFFRPNIFIDSNDSVQQICCKYYWIGLFLKSLPEKGWPLAPTTILRIYFISSWSSNTSQTFYLPVRRNIFVSLLTHVTKKVRNNSQSFTQP